LSKLEQRGQQFCLGKSGSGAALFSRARLYCQYGYVVVYVSRIQELFDSQHLKLLFVVQIFVIPVLIGLLFELLVIVPMRVPVDESPVFLLYQDWALGLIFLKIWTRLVSYQIVQSLLNSGVYQNAYFVHPYSAACYHNFYTVTCNKYTDDFIRASPYCH
jgi:hypothetical protein